MTMIRWIVGSSLKYRYLVIALSVIVMFLGFTRFRSMPIDVFPEFEPPLVKIQTEALGLSADEVESLITLNLEEFLSGTPWLETIRSESIPGLSSILLTFQPGTDIMRARQVVQESLSMAHTMPNVSKPPVMLQPLSATNRAMMVGLSSKELSKIQLSVLSRWTIKPKLMGVPGVANIVIWGQRARQLQVQIDPVQLQELGLTQDQIIRTAGDALWVSPLSYLNASVPGTGGWIDTPNQRLGIRHVLPISMPEDLAKVPVHGTDIRLGDVATVVEGHPPLIGDAYLDNGPGVILVIEKFPWANTLEVTKGVEDALDALKAGLPGLEVDTNVFRLANYIETAIDNLTIALIIGAVLVVLVLGAFLYDWRVTLISFVAIPLSLITAILVLYFLKTSINIMVLAGFGIALGALVDDAIIDIENIVRRLRLHRKEGSEKSTLAIILEASLEVRSPIIYATIIIVLAVSPIFVMGGIFGAFFQPLALSYSIALLASMVVALTVTPVLGVFFLSNAPRTNHISPLMTWLHIRYENVLSNVIKAPRLAFITVGILILLGLITWPFLEQSLLPSFKERELLVDIESTPGTSHPEMTRIMTRISNELRSLPGIRKVGAHTGRAITGDKVVNINSSQLWVSIDPDADYDNTVDAVKNVVAGYRGLDRDVQTYLDERIKEVISGTSEQIVVRLYGPKRKILSEKAKEIEDVLSNIEGIVDLRVEGQLKEPHVEIKVDIAKARPYGIKPGDVRRAAATIFAGIEAGYLFEEQKVFDVVVWSVPEARQSLTNIQALLIDTPDGNHVRLEDIADINIVATPTVINHEAISPLIDIVANVRGRDLGSVTTEVQNRLATIAFPLEYHPEILGEYTEMQRAKNQLIIVTIGVTIGIYLLLQACFGSWRLASLAFLALPTALVGGIFATLLNGCMITLGSLVGLLAVLGIATRNGIMLLKHYQHLRQDKILPFGPELVLRGAQERLAPILMTAATTALALLPLALMGDIAGLEIEHPMALVILGGLVTSTLLNMFIVPCLYLHFGANTQPENLDTWS